MNIFVSFPKSGRTWIRYILYLLELEPAVRFVHDGFGFNVSRAKKPVHDFNFSRRVSRYKNKNVVFLYRDPRQVMVSFYHQIAHRFQGIHGKYKGGFSDFIRDPYFGAEVLKQYTDMWVLVAQRADMQVINYERMHLDPVLTVRKVLDAFGMVASQEDLAAAINNSTFDKMRTVEEKGDFPKNWLRPKKKGDQRTYKTRCGGTEGLRLQNMTKVGRQISNADIDYLNSVFRSTG